MMWGAVAPAKDLVIRRARTLDAPALARIQVDSWRESYQGLIPQSYLAGLTYEGHERHWRRKLTQRSWAFVAVWQGQMVGFASGGLCRSHREFTGELYVLYLLRAYQRRGIGRALFDSVHFELARRSLADLVVWVLAENPARGFYERLGGEPVGRTSRVIGGVKLKEVAYGWRC